MYTNVPGGGRKFPSLTGPIVMLIALGFLVMTMGFFSRATEKPLTAQAGASPAQAGAAPPAQAGASPAQAGASPAQAGASPAQAGASPAQPSPSPPAPSAAPEKERPAAAPGSVSLPELKMSPAPKKAPVGPESEGALDFPRGTLKEDGGAWAPAGEEHRDSSFINQLGTTLLGLGIVCLLAFFLLRFLGARVLGKGALLPLTRGTTKLINVLERQLIAPQKVLLLVEVAGKYMLIGMSENSLYTLGEVEAELVDARVEAAQMPAVQAQPKEFRNILCHYFPFLQGKAPEQATPLEQATPPEHGRSPRSEQATPLEQATPPEIQCKSPDTRDKSPEKSRTPKQEEVSC